MSPEARALVEKLTDDAVAQVGRGPAWRLVFARLIAEECAQVAEDTPEGMGQLGKNSAAAIRERFAP